MPARPVLIPLGGFLGAGKSTLILSAARVLQAQGLKVAAILNDQGSELVDTHYIGSAGVNADQVTGGCFCCRFSELIDAAERLCSYAPDVIFAEAVGSCTDVSATTLQPLKLMYSSLLRLAPYSVLVDPERARELMSADADPDLSFLFLKQIDEADFICFTKTDLHSDFPLLTGAPVRFLSPLTGRGVAAWLDEILGSCMQPGGRILELDYERYAKAEASLAWLNCSATVLLISPLSPSQLVGPLIEGLDGALTSAGLKIAHLKLIDSSSSGHLKASVVNNGAEPCVEGLLTASPSHTHELLLNVRAVGEPETLKRIVECGMSDIPGNVRMKTMECFSPAPPQPEWRYA